MNIAKKLCRRKRRMMKIDKVSKNDKISSLKTFVHLLITFFSAGI
jgi:hypothetical protein